MVPAQKTQSHHATIVMLGGARDKDPKPGEAKLNYGAERLGVHGYDVRVTKRRASGIAKKIRDVFEHRSQSTMEEALRFIGKRADIVMSVFEHHAFWPALFRKALIPPFRQAFQVVMVCWAAQFLNEMEPGRKKRLTWALNEADLLLVLSPNQIPILRAQGITRPNIQAVPFGVETSFFTQPDGEPTRERIAAIGLDGGRDFQTLFDAVSGTGIEIDLYCMPHNLEGLTLPPEIVLHGFVQRPQYLSVLKNARAVVVPTHEFAYPTGQSVALEGASCGATVIVTSTPAMRYYFEHNKTAFMPPVGDVAALREQLIRVAKTDDWRDIGQAGHRLVHEQFSSDFLWDRVAEVLQNAR